MGILLVMRLAAQEEGLLDWDIDSIFNEPLEETPAEQTAPSPGQSAVGSLLQRRGFRFDAGYEFVVGIAPGWLSTPWSSGWEESGYYLDRFIRMRVSFGLDAQISEVFRAKSNIYFEVPNFKAVLGDFFFDYKLYDAVFFRGGKYNLSWGISPNYGFTNLLTRVPEDEARRKKYTNDPFIFKADVPVGMGGFQALAMTRINMLGSGAALPKLEDFGFGGKYNLAIQRVDLDTGIFYQEGMALRGFVSAKTTLWNTELYNEWLGAIDVREPSNISGAVNIGFEREFFDKKFNINGELFYNGEKDTYWYQSETNVWEAGTYDFIEGFNMAMNLRYRPWEKGNPRIFLRTLYAPVQQTAQLIPGFRFSPWRHLEFYLAVPMALGSEDSYYARHTITKTDRNTTDSNARNKPIPFAVIFMITLKGSVQFGHYY